MSNLLHWLPNLLFIAEGVFVTLKYSVISVCLGFILGIILALAKTSNSCALRTGSNIYTSIFRGTPLLVQLSIFYFVVPQILNIHISVLTAGITAFSLNSAAYISEIIKAGIESIDKGQREAAKVLNIPERLMAKDIILPQAIRVILPSLINELVNMIKESSIISILGELDLMRRAQLVTAQTYDYITPMLMVGLCYYVIVSIFTKIALIVEKKMKL
jgi:polar amino acid transport system permease protein